MLINGIRLSTLGAQLQDRVFTSNQVDTSEDWNEGSLEPTFIRQQDTFKDIALDFLIAETNEEDAFIVMSNLTMLLRKAIIVFDDMPNLQFDVTIDGQGTQKRLSNGKFLYSVKLKSDYAKGQSEVHTTNTAATDSFKLNVIYYKDTTRLVATDTVTISAASFVGTEINNLSDLGIDLDKYKEDHYNNGFVTNFGNQDLTYENLYSLGTMIINYSPTVYTKDVDYYIVSGSGGYIYLDSSFVSFTYADYQNLTMMGQLVNLNLNRPSGYKAKVTPNELPTFEQLMALNGSINVYFDIIPNERQKEITVNYYKEDDNDYTFINSSTVIVKEGSVVEGTTLKDIININGRKPNNNYDDGYNPDIDIDTLVTFDNLLDSYDIRYDKKISTIYVEYYNGTYPGWLRSHTEVYNVKYSDEYDSAENLFTAIGIDINKYKTDLYENGLVFNSSIYTDFDTLLSIGNVQIYYEPKKYNITVEYYQDRDDGTEITKLGEKDYIITDLTFANISLLSQVININEYRPEGFIFNEEDSYSGTLSIAALTQASPIRVVYKPVAAVNTKSIVIRYKKQLSSTYSTINTSVITIEEASVGGGVKLKDLFDINAFRPEYYNEGIIDGYSLNSTFLFDEIQGTYDVYYLASTYSTPVRYYTDEITTENWVGSDTISYTILDFDSSTTAVSLGVNINAYKPSYCGDGEIQYYGSTTFDNLINLESINIIYTAETEPGDDDIDYPHRILFLQHNDMGSYDSSFPSWTLNHAYINTGVTCEDMSKLTVAVSTVRVFEDQPLYNVNVGDRYLFGAISPNGSYYIKYQNNTTFTPDPNNHNYFIAAAGKGTPLLQIEEDTENGFSRNTGIYASERAGYSYCTLKYSNLIQTNNAQMLIPLYLFACNYNGSYTGGIAGVGITSCKIYYDGVLIRDFVPVQYYDLIGTKVAPSNCLYDKITQTFFEDARRMNSFNIMDDDTYEDKNPVHNIGKCYVNYLRDGGFFQSQVIYFRESDFINGNVWDPYTKLEVENHQPAFYGEGEIVNIEDLGGVTFNNVNNFIFNINYPSTGFKVNVKYFKDNKNTLLAAEEITLTESMFYSVPTFGQIIDLLKYKPDGYGLKQEDIPYKDDRVTLRRLLNQGDFDIIYTPWEDPEEYTITVKYYKHKNWIEPKNPINEYQYLGSVDVTIDATEIIDGKYPENFISFNLFKPEGEDNYWVDGAPYEWYLEDENLISPTDLREEYIVAYEPITQYIDINYYTDEVDDANLIANTTWGIKINDWAFGYEFQITDELPNSYFNKYRPVNCDGGILQNADAYYTFDSLVQQGHLDIVYLTRVEPHDPDDDSFPSKILWYYADKGDLSISDGMEDGTHSNARDWTRHNGGKFFKIGIGPRIPYLDLGYTPKEIQRLRVQSKYYSLGGSMLGSSSEFAPITSDYMGIFGYCGPMDRKKLRKYEGYEDARDSINGVEKDSKGEKYGTAISPESTGYFFLKGHCPSGSFGGSSRRATNNFWGGVISVDNNNGMKWSNDAQTQVTDDEIYHSCYKKVTAGFRFGKFIGHDEDLEPYKENDSYEFTAYDASHKDHYAKSFSNGMAEIWRSRIGKQFYYPYGFDEEENDGIGPTILALSDADTLSTDEWYEMNPSTFFNPYTVTLDAYNGYCEIFDMSNSKTPGFYNIAGDDINTFNDRCKPKGSLTLFVTRNPDTGKVNIAPAEYLVMPRMTNYNDVITGYSIIAGYTTTGRTKDNPAGHTVRKDTKGISRISFNDRKGTYSNASASDRSQDVGEAQDPSVEIYGGLLQMSYNPYKTQDISCPWSGGRYDAFPVPMRSAIWYLKVWDRDRLVRDLIPVAKGDMVYDYVMPANGMFDKVTEIFFGNVNEGGDYGTVPITAETDRHVIVNPEDVFTLRVNDDPTIYGKIIVNYYDYDNSFLGNQYIEIPCDYFSDNISFKELLHYNDMKPSAYYHDGMIDTDVDIEDDVPNRNKLKQIYDQGAINVYYKQKQYTKTVVYYNENSRIASKDFFFSQAEIEAANTLADLGVDAQLYASDEFKPGVIMSDETIIASDDVAAFINAPSPVVVYHKYTKEERPDLFYYEYYRGGAYEEEGQETLTLNSDNKNYLDCDMTAVVLNPKGAIKYIDHYHDALYEDETQEYFISYQVDVDVNYCEVHKGPARGYSLLAEITDRGRYTIVEENRGWGRLKEYPKGWILLSNTSPIVGPGQNPDYDTPNAGDTSNVIIPFSTRVSITKMTIDRLWAYVPEYASWIKTEEISFDQSGRLYNALYMGVIKLDKVVWDDVDSLSDLFNINKYKLRFHDDTTFSYDGPVTQEALSELHSIDIVYPETIYPYVVKYYKNTLDNENLVCSGGFSCSLSDWNPDWDTFLTTSFKTGYPSKITVKDTFHRTEGLTKDYDNTKVGDRIYVLRNSTTSVGGVDCYFCLWKGYLGYYPVAAINKGSNVETISPVLYRSGEPIYLTWDFYNLDANLYKPDNSYNDGIFLWNPRTYDNDDIKFSFEELITTGKQEVLYSPTMDIGYKARFTNGFLSLPMNISNFYYVPTSVEPGIWDIEIKYQPSYETKVVDTSSDHQEKIVNNRQIIIPGNVLKPGIDYYGTRTYDGIQTGQDNNTKTAPGRDIDILNSYTYRASATSISYPNTKYYDSSFIDADTNNKYYNIINFSNKREPEKAICQITGDDIISWKNSSPTFKSRSITRANATDSRVSADANDTSFSIDYLTVGNGSYYYSDRASSSGRNFYNKVIGYNMIYYVKVWKNYYLEHYYVPLPKGYWLPNGQQLTENTFYDLVTETLAERPIFNNPYEWEDSSEHGAALVNTPPTIVKLHHPNIESQVNVFDDWYYTIDTEACDLIVKTKNRISGYKYPDILSDIETKIDKNTIIPIKKLTADAAHHVQGTWYWTGSCWIQATDTAIYSYTDHAIEEYRKRLALKGDTSNTAVNYYGYRRPDDYQPEYFELEYANASNQYARLDTGIKAYQVGKIEVEFDYIDAPQHDNYSGYIIGSGRGYPSLIVDWSTDKVSGGETLIKGNHYKIVAVRETHNADSYNSTNPHDALMISVNGGTPVHFGITPGSYSNTYDSPVIINGCPTNGYSTSNKRYGIKAKYYSVKIWDTTGTLIYDLSFRAKQNGDTVINYGYNNLNQQYIEIGDYWTYPTVDWINPQSTSSIFTTEQTDMIYFKSNDFYWDGHLWIPASYTEDYFIEYETPKKYVVSTDSISYMDKPLINRTPEGNYLMGDRITVTGVLGKDHNWYKLSNGNWIFNNESLTELEE